MAGLSMFIMIWICLTIGFAEYLIPIIIIGAIVLLFLAFLV